MVQPHPILGSVSTVEHPNNGHTWDPERLSSFGGYFIFRLSFKGGVWGVGGALLLWPQLLHLSDGFSLGEYGFKIIITHIWGGGRVGV